MTAPITDRTILVTGGAGFIGSHIADRFSQDNEVRVLDDFSRGSRLNLPTDVSVIEGDVRDAGTLASAMADVDVVFHHAAMVSVERSVRRPLDCQEVNTSATLSVLDHARMADARVVFPSSAAIYGDPDSVPVAETAAKRPRSPYAIAKLAADLHVRRFADLYDLPTVVLRYFNVYGPRQGSGPYSGVIGTFLDQVRSGGPLTVEGNGQQTRDFVHVDDVVEANVLAARTDAVGRAFNVGTGSAVTIRELAETVAGVADATPDIVHTDARPGDVDESRADVARARERLGFEPSVSLEDGLADLLDQTAVDPTL
jgi:UDP-glucose 4-epimerase